MFLLGPTFGEILTGTEMSSALDIIKPPILVVLTDWLLMSLVLNGLPLALLVV